MFRNSISVLNELNEEHEITLEEWCALTPHRTAQIQQAAPERQESPKNVHSEFLVISVSPESFHEPDLFSELLDGTLENEVPLKQTSTTEQGSSEKKSKRKRRSRQK